MREYTSYIALAAYLALDWSSITERIHSLGWSAELVLYLGFYAAMAGALVLTASIRSRSLRLFYALPFAAGSVLLHTFEWSSGQPLTYSAFASLLDARGDTAEALVQYQNILARSLLAAGLLLVAFALPTQPRVPKPWPELAPICAIGLLTTVLFFRGGEGARALPAPFTPIAYSLLSTGNSVSVLRRGEPSVTRNAKPVTRDIVLIVDESISPLYLDISSRNGLRTGLVPEPKGVKVTSFGYAAAILNCSAGANATLRFGGRRDNYREMKESGISIWDYARRAGLRTVYLDGQRNYGELQNLMTPREKSKIDDFVQLDGVPIQDRDVTLAAALSSRINNGVPEFIYMNKVGGHFPIHDRFPDQMTVYKPILKRGLYTERRDEGLQIGFQGFDGSLSDWARYRNSYRNTLLWNVSTFFERLLTKADLSQATIIYTSDHGQDLHERGKPGYGTHCGTEPVPEEGIVPLVIIEGEQNADMNWSHHLEANHNKTSAYHIFPTLLALMHYDRQDILRYYGEPLDQQTNDPMTFNKDYYVLFGREPSWVPIRINDIAVAPSSDYIRTALASNAPENLQ